MAVRELFALPEDVVYLNTCGRSPKTLFQGEVGQKGLREQMMPWTLSSAPVETIREVNLFCKFRPFFS